MLSRQSVADSDSAVGLFFVPARMTSDRPCRLAACPTGDSFRQVQLFRGIRNAFWVQASTGCKLWRYQ